MKPIPQEIDPIEISGTETPDEIEQEEPKTSEQESDEDNPLKQSAEVFWLREALIN